MTVEINWLPQWTTPVKIESGGRHALGLNRYHDHLEDLLIKSIVWLAESLPYFTFACWAIGDIAINHKPTNYAEFVAAYQKRESAMAIGRYLWRPTDYIPGSNRVSAHVSTDRDVYETYFSVMQSEAQGAFGLYYAGSAYTLGLIEYDEKRVTNLTDAGWQLHQILDRRYKKTPTEYYRKYRGRDRVPKDVLIEWGRANDISAIRQPDARDERDFYKNLLFRLDQPAIKDLRRDTFAFFLECISHCNANNTKFTEHILRNIDYYSTYTDSGGTVRKFEVAPAFRDVHFYWNIYEGHVYFRQWLTRYFQVFLNHLKYQPYGSTVDEFFDTVDTGEFNETLSLFLGRRGDWLGGRLGDLMEAVGRVPRLDDPFSEESIENAVGKQTLPSPLMAMFALIMVDLWHHFRGLRTDQRYLTLATSLSADLWFEKLFHFPQLTKLTVRHFLRNMLETYVIQQHDRIMVEKRDLRRCWFTTESGRHFYVTDESLIGRPAKYTTIMSYLRDMGLIEEEESGLQITAEGHELFTTLKQEFLR